MSQAPHDPYAQAAAGWANGASRVYAPLAGELVRFSPYPLTGRLVLDVGAGTGCGSDALRAVGARPIAVDSSYGMLHWQRETRPPACAGDLMRLPLRDRCVDDAFAAFVLNHLRDPGAGLAELVRVTKQGGTVLATVFASTSHSVARDRVDELASEYGFVQPQWYVDIKAHAVPAVGSASSVHGLAPAAGLTDIRVVQRDVDVGIDTAADLVAYRLGQAHYADWLADFSVQARDELHARVAAAVEPSMTPYRPTVIFLSARVG